MKLRHDGNMPYWEGQSLGVTPPGVDANGKPHKVGVLPCVCRHSTHGSGIDHPLLRVVHGNRLWAGRRSDGEL